MDIINNGNVNEIIKNERIQGLIRVGISWTGAISTFLFYSNGFIGKETPIILSVYAGFSVVYMLIIYKYPGDIPIRRSIITLIDFLAVTISFYYGGAVSAIYSFAYVWITVGNSIRFGSRGLIESMVISLLSFTFLVVYSDFWNEQIYFSIGIYLIITIIPLYVLKLTNSLADLSRQLEKELSHANYLAAHDELSGLFNRATFFSILEQKIKDSANKNEMLMVMYIDLDGFKMINDQLGHRYGDVVIQRISERLSDFVRSSDAVCRLGGDEFAIILCGASEQFDATKFCKSVVNKVSEPMTVEGSLLHVTASIGVSSFPANGSCSKELTECADKAMYKSKSEGKNKFTICLSGKV